MTTRSKIQNTIQELEHQLAYFKSQLNSYPEVTIETAQVGDTLEDGSIVLQKENGLALLVAPKSTEVTCSWSPEFPEVYAKLKEQGFNPSQWFVPTKEQLQLAYERIKDELDAYCYWSSTEIDSVIVWRKSFHLGGTISSFKERLSRARAFRCVTY